MAVLKIPVFNKHIDYFDITRKGSTLLSIKDEQIYKKKWRDLQKIIGDELGTGLYTYTLKWRDSDKVETGRMRAVAVGRGQVESEEYSGLNSRIDQLNKKLDSMKTDDKYSDMILTSIKESFNIRIDSLNDQLRVKDQTIIELNKEINELEKELDEMDEKLTDSENKIFELESNNSEMSSWLPMIKKMIDAKMKKVTPLSDFSSSDTTDIPKKILDIIGLVDFSKVSEDKLNELAYYLNAFVQTLPLKGV